MLKFVFDLYSVSCHISKHYSKHGKSPYFVRPIFLYFYQIKLALTYNLRLTLYTGCNSLNIVVVNAHQQRSMMTIQYIGYTNKYELQRAGRNWILIKGKFKHLVKRSLYLGENIIICVLWWLLGFQRKKSPLFC